MSRRSRYSDSSLRFLTLKGERELPKIEEVKEIEESEEVEEEGEKPK